MIYNHCTHFTTFRYAIQQQDYQQLDTNNANEKDQQFQNASSNDK